MARGIDKARRLFERGMLIPSAEALRKVRIDGVSRHDAETVAQADHVADEMRGQLDEKELKSFNDGLAGVNTAVVDEEVDVSPVGLGLALVGAIACLSLSSCPMPTQSPSRESRKTP